jgi:hypothetical protein
MVNVDASKNQFGSFPYKPVPMNSSYIVTKGAAVASLREISVPFGTHPPLTIQLLHCNKENDPFCSHVRSWNNSNHCRNLADHLSQALLVEMSL